MPLPCLLCARHQSWWVPGSKGKVAPLALEVISERGVIFRTGGQAPVRAPSKSLSWKTPLPQNLWRVQVPLCSSPWLHPRVPLLSNSITLGLPAPTSQMGKLRHREGMGAAVPSCQSIACFSEDRFLGLMGEGVGGTHEGLRKPQGRA